MTLVPRGICASSVINIFFGDGLKLSMGLLNVLVNITRALLLLLQLSKYAVITVLSITVKKTYV